MDTLDVLSWTRLARPEFDLGNENGLYALFLRSDAHLPTITPGGFGLIYIGKASGKKGLKGRCHFLGSTRNHSPRKSLAFLLKGTLSLVPVIVQKPNSSPTWTLEPESEVRLSSWMMDSLLLAAIPMEQPESTEGLLIHKYAPPLNLTGCVQTARHLAISQGRKSIQAQTIANLM